MAEEKNTRPTEPNFSKETEEYLESYFRATPEQDEEAQLESDLQTLRNSYQMYEQSKAEMIRVRSSKKDKYGNRIYTDGSIRKTLALMETAQEDIKTKYLQLGGDVKDLEEIKAAKKRIDRSNILKAIEKANKEDGIRQTIKKAAGDTAKPFPTAKGSYSDFKSNEVYEPETLESYKVPKQLLDEKAPKPVIKNVEEKKKEEDFNRHNKMEQQNAKEILAGVNAQQAAQQPKKNTTQAQQEGITVRENNGNAPYDTISLPSKGECYRGKFREVSVGYLTAYDENLILSPNLYRKGTFLDHILKNKVKGVDPDKLVQGDRDAIIIWLRASGYGNEYPVTVTDDKTGEDFDTVVDLSTLKYRKFTLKGDEEGYFSFTLPVTKDVVKFKFLTNNDTKKLQEMQNEEDKQYRVGAYNDCLNKLRGVIEDNELINEESYQKLVGALNTLETEGSAVFEGIPEIEFSHDMTNRLILSTVSINGNTDKRYIADYILNLNVKDAKAYREYIIDNEPGIDYNVKVERPESLGGGFINTFLRLDQFIFVSKV